MIVDQLPYYTPKVLAFDIETKTVGGVSDPFRDQILLLSMSDGRETWVLTRDFHRAKELLEDTRCLKLVHNGSFDLQYLKRIGIDVYPIWDTLIIERVLTAGTFLACDLSSVSKRRANIDVDKSVREKFEYSVITKEKLDYSAKDSEVLLPIYESQRIEVSELKLGSIANLENALVNVVAAMELQGIGLDAKAWDEIVLEETPLRDAAAQRVVELLGGDNLQFDIFGETYGININSQPELLKALRDIGIDLDDTKEETLQDYYFEHPECDVLQDILIYREHTKALQFDYPKFVNPLTGLIHADINQMGADTSRFSYSNPNLQQVKRVNKFRSCFIPSKGGFLITSDYSQLQLRLMAEASHCKLMLQQFRDREDLHAALASKAYGVLVTKDDPRRQKGKTTNFAKIFGAYPGTLAKSLGSTLEEAEKLSKAFDLAYPEIKAYGARQHSFLVKNKYVRDLSGRIRWFKNVNEENKNKFRNKAANTPIQSLEATIMKKALVAIYYELKMVPSLCVHDEVVVESFKPEVDALEIKRVMEMAGKDILQEVDLVVDYHIDTKWQK